MSETDKQIENYLQSLKSALSGTDKAIVQDALSDAEEHLRAALHTEMDRSPQEAKDEVLEKIIADYGSPQEVAQAYRSWESDLPPTLAPTAQDPPREQPEVDPRAQGFFGVFADPRAWGGVVYMLISLVTGTLYFSWAVAGLSTSLGVMILIIGIPVTILFLLSVRGLAFLEGRLVEALLGERMPRRPAFTDPHQSWTARLKQLLLGKSTWLALLYMVLMLPLGVTYFSVMVTALALSAGLIAAPVLDLGFGIPVVNLGSTVYHIPLYQVPFFILGGVLLATAVFHVARWTGRLHGKLAKTLLVKD